LLKKIRGSPLLIIGISFNMCLRSVFPDNGAPRASMFASLLVRNIRSYRGGPGSLLNEMFAANRGPLCYLQNRNKDLEILGVGAYASFQASSYEQFRAQFGWIFSELREHAAADNLFLLGGTSFDGQSPKDEWLNFAAVHFFLPRMLYVRRHDIVSVFELSNRDEPVVAVPPQADRSVSEADGPELAEWRNTLPSFFEWERGVELALKEIKEGRLEKVVLARRASANLRAPTHPAVILHRLLTYPQRISAFAFAPTESLSPCFLGATPELLFTLQETTILSEAVAGTLSLRKTEGCSENSVIIGPKERSEHEFVVAAIVERLGQVSAEVYCESEPKVVALHDLMHVVTPIRARVTGATDPIELLGLLHPTPAVGGTPSIAARNFIRTHEPFDRGWYAGTIGYINPRESEFSVSLRSALIDGCNLAAFVGAGIVRGSSAAREWEELDLKQRRLEEIVTDRR